MFVYFSKIFKIMCVSFLQVCTHEGMCWGSLKEGITSPRVTGGCELPSVGTGNQTESSRRIANTEPSV